MIYYSVMVSRIYYGDSWEIKEGYVSSYNELDKELIQYARHHNLLCIEYNNSV